MSGYTRGYMLMSEMISLKNSKKLKKVELHVLEYLIDNYEDIDNLTATNVAENCFCSTSSVNRLCKKLDVNGFTELKFVLCSELNVPKKIISESMNLNLEQIINHNTMLDFASSLIKCELLYIYATGGSKVSALYLQRQLFALSIPVIMIHDISNMYHFKNIDLVVISSSGEIKKVLDVVQIAKKNGSNIYAITALDSSLDRLSHVSFTHNLIVDRQSLIEKEQQIHLLTMVNVLINGLIEVRNG